MQDPNIWCRQARLVVTTLLVGMVAAPTVVAAYPGKNGERMVKNEIVLIGASYAKNWPLERFQGLPVVNKGVAGEETHQVLKRFGADVLERKPKKVILWGFINDIFRSPKDKMHDTVERARQNLQTMVALAVQNGIEPIVATEVTITAPDAWDTGLRRLWGRIRGKQSYQDYINGHVRSVNTWIRDWSKERKLTLIDLEGVLSDSSGERRAEYATADGSHLSDAAYVMLSKYVERSFPAPAP